MAFLDDLPTTSCLGETLRPSDFPEFATNFDSEAERAEALQREGAEAAAGEYAPPSFEPSAEALDDPLASLPPRYELNDDERRRAEDYRNGRFGNGFGYVLRQIAAFRAPKAPQRHAARRAALDRLLGELPEGFVLPSCYVELMRSDDAIDRLRHNTLWLVDPSPPAALPQRPGCLFVELLSEGQGCLCGQLPLGSDGQHAVTLSDVPIGGPLGIDREPPSRPPKLWHAADSLAYWLLHYFEACREGDEHYSEMWAKFSAMQ